MSLQEPVEEFLQAPSFSYGVPDAYHLLLHAGYGFGYIIRAERTLCNSTIAERTQKGKAGAQEWHCRAFIGDLFPWTTICVLSVLSGTWPFGVVESVWKLVALRRWWHRRKMP